MQIRIAQETFSTLLSRAQSVVERKSTRAILENILLEAAEGRLRVAATDLRISLTQEQSCLVERAGSIAVPARKLHEVVREIPKGDVVLEVQENQWVTVVAGKSRFHLPGAPAEDFPTMPLVPESFLAFPAPVFRKMIERTLFAASNDESRIYLTGVFLKEWADEGATYLRMVSTDGHRLALIDRALDKNTGIFRNGVIIPKKGLGELKSLLEGVEGDFEMTAGDGRIYARVGNASLAVTLIDAAFPNYEQVVPSDVRSWIQMERIPLVNALKRVSLLSDEETRTVILEASGDQLVVSSDNPRLGDARDEMEIEYREAPVRIAFNASYFLDLLRVLDGSIVKLGIVDGLAPCLVRDAEDSHYLSVIMPMRLE